MVEYKKNEIAQKIGTRIYNLRQKNKLSREKFAEICDLSSQHVYYIEKGEFLPGCLTILEICNNFSITPSQLLTDCLNTNFNLFDESVKQNYNKLSYDDKKFLQELIVSSIDLLLDKEKPKKEYAQK